MDLLKCLFGGMWSLCKCLVGLKKLKPSEMRKLVEPLSMRKRFRKGNPRTGLDKLASTSKASMDTVSENLDMRRIG